VFAAAAALLAAAAVWGLVMVRADAQHDGVDDPANHGPLTAEQYAAAVRVAKGEITREQAHVTSATAILVRGKEHHGNLGPPCSSGHEIKIRLIGRFPNTNVGGPPDDGQPVPHGLYVTTILDAATLQACVTGVSLGHGTPYPHSADLLPAISGR
jgi:hypothetical protein